MIEQPPFQPGDTFNEEFEILHLLGSGGSAWVYRVREKFTDLEFALKLIPKRKDVSFERRVHAEILALHRLVRHPAVVQIFNAGVTDSFMYIKMELLDGLSLRQILDELKFLGVAELLSIGADICSGVGAAHRRAIIHRDLKPANILVCPGNDVKVVDFGVVKIQDEKRDTTGRLRWHGTPLYMSPEHLQGERVTPQSDVYALGVMMHEALLGRHFCHVLGQEPPSWVTIGWMQIREPIPPLADLVPGFPRTLSDVIARATEKSPDRRWRDAMELGGALAAELRNSERIARLHGAIPAVRDLVTEARLARERRIQRDGAAAAPASAFEVRTVAGDSLEPFQRTTARMVLTTESRKTTIAAEAAARVPSSAAVIEAPSKHTVPNTPAALRLRSSHPPVPLRPLPTRVAEPQSSLRVPASRHETDRQEPRLSTNGARPTRVGATPSGARAVPPSSPKAAQTGVLGGHSLPYLYAAAVVFGLMVSVPLGLLGARALAHRASEVKPTPLQSGSPPPTRSELVVASDQPQPSPAAIPTVSNLAQEELAHDPAPAAPRAGAASAMPMASAPTESPRPPSQAPTPSWNNSRAESAQASDSSGRSRTLAVASVPKKRAPKPKRSEPELIYPW